MDEPKELSYATATGAVRESDFDNGARNRSFSQIIGIS